MNDEEIKEIILEPDPARVMEGLRDTGYDFNTAMADIIDNSIAANATLVKVYVNINPKNEVRVFIADNGIGMDKNGLLNAMKYGSQERSDPSSLGKFGLGLKTASTAFCRCLSLLSKTNTSEYHKVRWDLDEIARINKWKLLEPAIEKSEINLLESVSKGGSGTLVIWDKVDRLMKNYSNIGSRNNAFKRIIDKLKSHLSMVYQRFLDHEFEGVKHFSLFLNDEPIKPWDPFCLKEPKTQLLASQPVKVEFGGKESFFNIKAYLLPRVDEFSNPQAKKDAKISNDMEGFYVYRENRLIYFGSWLDMFVNDPHISLLRVDFSFDHTLDEQFNVDIKKSRIILNEEIFEYIKNVFMPAPRREAENLYRKGQTESVKKTSAGAHVASNNNIDLKAASVEESKVEIIDAAKDKVKISNAQGSVTGTIKILPLTKPGQYRVVPVSSIESNMLWEPSIVDGKHAVAINQSHEYYSKVYAPVLDNPVLVTGMDALLWALAEAELSTYNEETKEQYYDMRVLVSKIIKKLVNDLPDPSIEDKTEE